MAHINEMGEIIRDDSPEPAMPVQSPAVSADSGRGARTEGNNSAFRGSVGGYITGSISASILATVLFAISASSSGSLHGVAFIVGVITWAVVTAVGALIFVGTMDDVDAKNTRDAFNRSVGGFLQKALNGLAAAFGAAIGGMIVAIFFLAPLVVILIFCIGGVVIYYIGKVLGFSLIVLLAGVVGASLGFLLGGLVGYVFGSVARRNW